MERISSCRSRAGLGEQESGRQRREESLEGLNQ